ncbi:MAG: fused response regulator/phosphatase [Mucilaginibacter sp.]|nr:fused response regulator/phosphatase [Mucilaginibacter sp.]
MPINTPRKILLVDDNPLFLKLMEQAFKKYHFKCHIVSSAEEAISFLKTNSPPDIILSDYEMLEMNGIDFRKYLMNEPELKDIPFVFLTYLPDKDLMIKGLDLRAIDFLLKDTPVNVIVSKINNILFTIEKQRELSEIEIKKAAASLNFKSIPVETPHIKGFDIDFWHHAYKDIPGGDFIDFIRVNDRYSFIVLGDVMGKKWMAWFFTFGFLSYIRSALRFAAFDEEYSTATILKKVNNIICYDSVLKDILLSLSLILIDSDTNKITYSGAGDLPLLHYKARAHRIIQVASSGLLLGLFEQGNYTQQEISLKKGDRLFFFTDGMIDFVNETGKKSDYQNFADTLQSSLAIENTFTKMKKNLFSKSLNKQVDDQTIISIYKS